MQRLRDLNVARGWAAIWVAAFHLTLLWPDAARGPMVDVATGLLRYGWTGVDLFFVLSGFVLSAPYLRVQAPPPAYRLFMGRRWLRIAPPYYAAILLALLLLNNWSTLGDPPRSLPQLLLFAQNLTPDTLAHVNPVFWTLAVEFQFYLLLPWLIRGFQTRYWTVWAASLVVTSLVWRAVTFAGPDGRWDPWAGLQVFPFLGHFGLGMAAARLWQDQAPLSRAALGSWIALALGVALPLALWIPMGDISQATGDRLRYVVVRPWLASGFAAFILLRAMASAPGIPRPGRLRGDFFGDISYSLYLVHVPVFIVLHGHLPVWPETRLWVLSLILASGALVVAVALYFAVERPSMIASRRVGRSPMASTQPPGPGAPEPLVGRQL